MGCMCFLLALPEALAALLCVCVSFAAWDHLSAAPSRPPSLLVSGCVAQGL